MALTQDEINQVISQIFANNDRRYANIIHLHQGVYSPIGHEHDDRYYTQDEIDDTLATRIYGTEYDFTKKVGRNSTNSVSGRPILTLNYAPIVSGIYKVKWSYQYAFDSTEFDFWAELSLNNNVFYRHQDAPTRVSGSYENLKTNKVIPVSGFDVFEMLSGQDYEIKMVYGTTSKDYWSVLVNPIVEIFRVG